MQIYIHRNNQQLGPYTEEELKTLLATRMVSPEDHAWWQGQATWVPLSQTPYGRTLPPGTTPIPVPGAPQSTPPDVYGKTSNLAIWSLVCACLSLVCGLLTAIPAIILGHLSLSEIKKDPTLKGRGMALGGLIISYGLIIISVVAISVLIALGNQVQDTFKKIQALEEAAQKKSSTDNNDSDQTPTATPTTTPADSNTNAAPVVTP